MKKNEAGFSYIDVLIAITILLVGVLALAGAIAGSVIRSRQQEQQLLAKQYATSTLESVISARDLNAFQLGWDSIGNVGSNPVNGVNRGVFLSGEQPLYPQSGPDQVVGTGDDTGTQVPGMTRQITISDICDTTRPSANCATPGVWPVMMRQVTVTIYYQAERMKRSESISTILAKY
jgi:type II secretory pathway pseudopilin PulG